MHPQATGGLLMALLSMMGRKQVVQEPRGSQLRCTMGTLELRSGENLQIPNLKGATRGKAVQKQVTLNTEAVEQPAA